jgi:hypothetical protein
MRIEPMNDNHQYTTKEKLEEFKELTFKEYGVKLTNEQAYEQGSALLRLVDCLIEKTIGKRRYQDGKIAGRL